MNIAEEKILNNFASIVLAAGKGTRLNCVDVSKVMLEINGKPMVQYVVDTLKGIGFQKEQLCLVVGYKKEIVKEYFKDDVIYADQNEQLGTAHATYVGMQKIGDDFEDVLVLNGDDSLFYKKETLINFMKQHNDNKCMISVLTTTIDPSDKRYGRVIKKDRKILLIEKENLTEEEERETQTSTGTFCINIKWFLENFKNMEKIEGLGEYGLPTAFEQSQKQGHKVLTISLKDPREWYGINSKEELEEAKQRTK